MFVTADIVQIGVVFITISTRMSLSHYVCDVK